MFFRRKNGLAQAGLHRTGVKSPAVRRRRGLCSRRRSLIGRRHAAMAGTIQAGISLRPKISTGTNLQPCGQCSVRRHPGHDRFHYHTIATRSGRPAITLCRLLEANRFRAARSTLSISGASGRIRGRQSKGPGSCQYLAGSSKAAYAIEQRPPSVAVRRRALECDQNNYRAHYQLALCLLDQGLFAEAESHLHWCLQRASSDKSVEIKLKEALKGRLDAERCAANQKGDKF